MLDYMPVAGTILLTIIIACGVITAWRRANRHTGGLIASTSLCCGSPMRPIGWTEDGWVAACQRCDAWQYLGDDHDNPPAGFYANGRPIIGLYAGGHVYSFSRPSAPRPAANRPDDAKVVGPEVTSEEEAHRLTENFRRNYPALTLLYDDACRLPDKLPPEEAGRIDANGNVTWCQGFSLSGGVVRIHADELDKARSAGWHAVDTDGDYVLVDRDTPTAFPSDQWATLNFSHLRQAEIAEDMAEQAEASSEEGEPLETPPLPNIGGVDHPDYKGPHYDVEHDQFVPYDMLSDPIPGTAVHAAGNVAVAGPIPPEKKS